MQQPIILWEDNTEAANSSEGPFPLWLLDGRNRLAALKLLGIEDPNQAPSGQVAEAKVGVLHALEGALVGGKASRTTWKGQRQPDHLRVVDERAPPPPHLGAEAGRDRGVHQG